MARLYPRRLAEEPFSAQAACHTPDCFHSACMVTQRSVMWGKKNGYQQRSGRQVGADSPTQHCCNGCKGCKDHLFSVLAAANKGSFQEPPRRELAYAYAELVFAVNTTVTAASQPLQVTRSIRSKVATGESAPKSLTSRQLKRGEDNANTHNSTLQNNNRQINC